MDYLIFLLILVGFIILIMFFQYINSKKSDKLYILSLNNSLKQNDISSYDRKRLGFAADFYRRHIRPNSLDDITWNDLSMDDIFMSIDKTESDMGCQYLYYLLRTPMLDTKHILSTRQQILFWIENYDIRNKMIVELHHIGMLKRFSFYDNLDSLDTCENQNSAKYLRLIICLIISFITVFFFKGFGILFFIFMFSHNMVIFYRDRMSINSKLMVLDRILKVIDASRNLNNIVIESGNSQYSENIDDAIKKVKSFEHSRSLISRMGGEGNPIIMLFSILGAVVFADFFRYYRLRKAYLENKESIELLIEAVGRFDAYISMSIYVERMKDKGLCVPEFLINEKHSIYAYDLYHPLIDNPVKNDIATDKSILITGANASGKSTFLKAMALSVIFAQTMGFVCAKEYKASIYLCMSSMSINDSVCDGDSYYMAEIKAVKRIIDSKNEYDNIPFICFIDELLRGTNTVERIAASTQILKSLDDSGILVCGATHDLELTELLLDFDNYHFEEDMTNGDVNFSYEIGIGPATTRNAIRLLDKLGFDKSITEEAETMVCRYVDTGLWSI